MNLAVGQHVYNTEPSICWSGGNCQILGIGMVVGKTRDREGTWKAKSLSQSIIEDLVKVTWKRMCFVAAKISRENIGRDLIMYCQPMEILETKVQTCPTCPCYPLCPSGSSRCLGDAGMQSRPGTGYRPRLPAGEGCWRKSEASCWAHYSLMSQRQTKGDGSRHTRAECTLIHGHPQKFSVPLSTIDGYN